MDGSDAVMRGDGGTDGGRAEDSGTIRRTNEGRERGRGEDGMEGVGEAQPTPACADSREDPTSAGSEHADVAVQGETAVGHPTDDSPIGIFGILK